MTMPRETGSEMGECANCGGPVPILESPYGSTSPGPCPKCYPAEAPREVASSSTPPRELGSSVGTSVSGGVPTEVPSGSAQGDGSAQGEI